jgi:hypothetical protein
MTDVHMRDLLDSIENIEEAPGDIRKGLAAIAIIAGLWGVNNNLAQQAYESSPQLQKLTAYLEVAKEHSDQRMIDQLEQRIENHKLRLDLGKGEVMGKDGKPVDVVYDKNESIDRLKKLAGIPITEDGDEIRKVAVGHVDDESDMMRKELYKIGKYSVELYKMLGELPDGDFPHWWQAKIVKAGEYIGAAKHYLEGEMYSPEEESPLDRQLDNDDEINPSGV